jgi:ubiquinone/menaquinone biosynthesis C-methylase UbiE
MRASAWDKEYREDRHIGRWDTPWPSPELAGYLAAIEMPRVALDVGCGTGSDAIYMAQHGIQVTGLDLSTRALEIASDRAAVAGATVTWMVGDALDLKFEEASVDLVTDRGCLHHIPDQSRPLYAAQLARVLRPGGTFFVRGMSESGKKKIPVSAESLEKMIANQPLTLSSALGYTMVGTTGTALATLGVVNRTND